MARKIARQSEVTPTNTIDEYLWNNRLGVTQLPPVNPSQGQPNTSSLPPDPSAAPTLDYDSSIAPNDQFGSGVSGAGQLIAPKTPNTTPASNPARSKAASNDMGAFDLAKHLMDEHGVGTRYIRDHDENVKLHDDDHANYPDDPHYMKTSAVSIVHAGDDEESIGAHLVSHHDVDPPYVTDVLRFRGASKSDYILTLQELHNLTHRHPEYSENLIEHEHKTSAVSTLYGDVDPTPTTGESSSGNGPQVQPPNEPNNPKVTPEGPAEGAEGAAAEGAEGAASGIGSLAELAPLALASKRLADNGSQSNRNNSSENLPNGPDAKSVSPAAAGEEEGGAGLATDLGEAASLAVLASKHFIGSVLDPVTDNLKFSKYHYIRKEGDQYCIWQKNTGKTLSCHDSKEKAEASFRAMEMGKHS